MLSFASQRSTRGLRPGRPASLIATLALAWGLGAPASASDPAVLRVPAEYPFIQTAVNVAHDGDVILIGPGEHAFDVDIDGLGLSLVGDSSGLPPRLLGSVTVRNTHDGQPVLIQGLRLWSTRRRPAVSMLHCDGNVRLEDCDVRGLTGFNQPNDPVYPGFIGVAVEDCRAVVLSGCEVAGGSGANLDGDNHLYGVGPGAAALDLTDAGVVVTGGLLRGGSGGSVFEAEPNSGGPGGAGVVARSSSLWLQGVEVHGGNGGSGDCDFFSCGSGGSGGAGLVQSGNATAVTRVRNSSLAGGAPGLSGDLDPGTPGADQLLSAGTLVPMHAPAGTLELASPLRAGDAGVISTSGAGLDGALPGGSFPLGLLVSGQVGHQGLPALQGVLQVGAGSAFVLGAPALPGAPLELPFVVPADALGGLEVLTLTLQAVTLNAGGAVVLGPARSLVLLDAGP